MSLQSVFASSLLIFPVTAFSQSYDWFDRWPDSKHSTQTVDIAASEFGIYTTGIEDDSGRRGFVAKHRAEDGKRLWRYRDVDELSFYNDLAVNEHGVFIAAESSVVQHYSHDGALIWSLQGVGYGVWRDIVLDQDGLYVVGSKTTGPSTPAAVQHISFDGEVLWTVELDNDTEYGWTLTIGDGMLYVLTAGRFLDVIETNGSVVRRFQIDNYGSGHNILWHEGALYLGGWGHLERLSLDGTVVWRLPFDPTVNGMESPRAFAASDEGLVVAVNTYRQIRQGIYEDFGRAFVRVDFDGNITAIENLPGHLPGANEVSIWDNELYIGGTQYISATADLVSYAARYSSKTLPPPPLLALGTGDPSMPPRLAVLAHDFGAGPVRTAIREAYPDSTEQTVEFSSNLKPVGYEKVPDLNSNGYEELAVVSRLPAVVEVRDSLDGSLLSTLKLGERFEPMAATVDASGAVPFIAIVERNTNTQRLLLRVYDLADSTLVSTLYLNRNFDPVDVVAIPSAGGSSYAILAESLAPGSPHKIEIRGSNGALEQNYWMDAKYDLVEIELVDGVTGPALSSLRNDSAAQRPNVRTIDLQGSYDLTTRFSEAFSSVAMTVVPDTGSNGHPQIVSFGEKTDGRVKAESRDAGSGQFDYRVALPENFHPQDANYIGATPGYGDHLVGLLALRESDGSSVPNQHWVFLIDAETGNPQFQLQFMAPD
jgi:outer membrane protein assembly factor BamB